MTGRPGSASDERGRMAVMPMAGKGADDMDDLAMLADEQRIKHVEGNLELER